MSDLAKANKEAFDQFAATYDAEAWQLQLVETLTNGLQQHKDWIGAQWSENGSEVKLLDYACGTGLATIALKPFVTHITGLDLSEGMVKKYNETMKQLGLSKEQAYGQVADLTASSSKDLPEAQDHYDVAIISLALHHVEDPKKMLEILAARLKPDGVLIVTDFLPFGHALYHDHAHKMAHTVKQHGFTEDEMAKLYRDAGLEDFKLVVLPKRISIGHGKHENDSRDLFIARGIRKS